MFAKILLIFLSLTVISPIIISKSNNAVKRTDDSGKLITDPETCNRGSYTNFVGFFCCDPME